MAPDANTQTAVFGSAISAARTVFTDTVVTVKGVEFDNDKSYRIAGDTVTLSSDTGASTVTVTKGNHQFQAVVSLANAATVTTAGLFC